MEKAAAVTQAEFARIAGFTKSRITQLKQAGRLVLDERGQVRVAESLARIEATADPAHAAVAERHAQARASRNGGGAASNPPETDEEGHGGPGISSGDYKAWQTRKMRADAQKAEIERDEMLRRLIPAEAADFALADLAAAVRSELELLPVRLTPDLLHISGADALESALAGACEQVLDRLRQRLKKRGDELRGAA